MTTERKNQIKQAVKNADAALEANPKKAVAEAKVALGLQAEKPAKVETAEKPAKPAKEPKAKKLAATKIEIDTAVYVKAYSKAPGTGKRDPKAVWKFLIGEKAVEIASEFYRDAKSKAIEAAIEANAAKVQVLA